MPRALGRLRPAPSRGARRGRSRRRLAGRGRASRRAHRPARLRRLRAHRSRDRRSRGSESRHSRDLRSRAQHDLPRARARVCRGDGLGCDLHRRQRGRLLGLSRLPPAIPRGIRGARQPRDEARGRGSVHRDRRAHRRHDEGRHRAPRRGTRCRLFAHGVVLQRRSGGPRLRALRRLPFPPPGVRGGRHRRSDALPRLESAVPSEGPLSGSASHLGSIVALGGFLLAFVFGAVANRTNFCTMGAVSDVVNMGSWARMRMWLLAIAVAILGTHALQLAGLIDLTKSIYVRPNFTWLSYILGGFLFGVGMTLGSGCGSKTLVRLGAGSLKSLIVFVFLGIAAYMTLKGLFAIWRQGAIDRVAADLTAAHMPRQDLPTMIAALTGASLPLVELAVAIAVAGALLASYSRTAISARASITSSAEPWSASSSSEAGMSRATWDSPR